MIQEPRRQDFSEVILQTAIFFSVKKCNFAKKQDRFRYHIIQLMGEVYRRLRQDFIMISLNKIFLRISILHPKLNSNSMFTQLQLRF